MKDKYVLFHEVNTSSRFYRIGMPLENDIKSRLYLWSKRTTLVTATILKLAFIYLINANDKHGYMMRINASSFISFI